MIERLGLPNLNSIVFLFLQKDCGNLALYNPNRLCYNTFAYPHGQAQTVTRTAEYAPLGNRRFPDLGSGQKNLKEVKCHAA